ncbi:uncharacterized protein LOC127137684 [Lathyrus oleraceus]|uniref:uncharacterized protein LOC127137684 n=1 Tax=Pisum sativum TaxID=3888 RepID=UPI0021D3A791|nr:uncharacterized protein LOC127137684 [Pisum sativum]
MAGKIDRATTNMLKVMANVIAQTNEVLQENQNQNAGDDELYGLGKIRGTIRLLLKEDMTQRVLKVGCRRLRKSFKLWVAQLSKKCGFATYMLFEKVEYWWDNIRQRLGTACTEITSENFKKEFLENYFSTNVCNNEEIEFLEVKKGNMIFADYLAKFEELVRFSVHYNGVEAKGSKCIKYESGLHLESKIRWYQEILRFSMLVNKCRIYDEDNTTKSAYYKSYSHHAAEWKSPCLKCFKYGKQGHRSTKCKSNVPTCYNCREPSHISTQCQKQRNVPVGTQAHGRVFALSGVDVSISANLIRGTRFINSDSLIALIDTGATYSFISLGCVDKFSLKVSSMIGSMVIDTPLMVQ